MHLLSHKEPAVSSLGLLMKHGDFHLFFPLVLFDLFVDVAQSSCFHYITPVFKNSVKSLFILGRKRLKTMESSSGYENRNSSQEKKT